MWNFFWHITILFHQCNNKNTIYQQFYCCLCYIFSSQLILTRNGSDVLIDYRRTAVGQKAVSVSAWRKTVEFDPDEYQKFKYHRYVQKSYVPTPLRAPITTCMGTNTNLSIIFFLPSSVPSQNLLWQTNVNCNTNQLGKVTINVKLLAVLNNR